MSSLRLDIIACNQYLSIVLCSTLSETMRLPYLDVLYQVICVELRTFSTREKYPEAQACMKVLKHIFSMEISCTHP